MRHTRQPQFHSVVEHAQESEKPQGGRVPEDESTLSKTTARTPSIILPLAAHSSR